MVRAGLFIAYLTALAIFAGAFLFPPGHPVKYCGLHPLPAGYRCMSGVNE